MRVAARPLAWPVLLVTVWLTFAAFSYAQQSLSERVPSKVCSPQAVGSLQLLDLSGLNIQEAEEHYARALRLQAGGDVVGAEKEFRAAWLLKPMEDRYVRGLAVFYIQRARYEEAIEVIADHVKVCGATALGLELQGELLFHQKNYDVAFEMVRRSLDLFNNNARMHQLLALIYVTHGQNPLAVDELQIAAELEPNQPQIRYFYGRVLYDTGRYPEARDQFLACLKIQPGFRKALENLALCHEALRDFPKAIQAYREAIALEKTREGPQHGEPYAFYGALLAKLRRSEEALSVLRQAVRVSPRSFVANFHLGRVLLTRGHLQEADKFLLNAANLAPKFSRTYYFLGKLRQKQSRAADAGRYWARFKQLDQAPESRKMPLTDR